MRIALMLRKSAYLWTFGLLFALSSGAWASGANLLAMNGQGAALHGSVGSLLINPAAAGGVTEHEARALLNVTRDSEGLAQLFYYAEPSNGVASGALALVGTREITAVDGGTGNFLYDRTQSWTYAAAMPLGADTVGGARIAYDRVTSEERGVSGNGYRLDVGLIRRLQSGLSVGLRVDGVVGTGIRWNGGGTSAYPRTIGLGAAWEGPGVTVAVDVVGDSLPGSWDVRAGVATDLGPISVAGGVSTSTGSTLPWFLGFGYDTGDLELTYTYDHGTNAQLAGVSWQF